MWSASNNLIRLHQHRIDCPHTDAHSHLVGKIAKLTERGLILEKEYEELFGIGNYGKSQLIHYYCNCGGRYEISLMFIDEKPVKRNGVTWFCVKEIGTGVSGDWHYYTLNQLMICN